MIFKTLDRLPNGSSATVTAVRGDGPFRRRLLEMGMVPGTRVERTGQAPLGDPLQYRVRDAVLCLRSSEAATVEIDAHPIAAK